MQSHSSLSFLPSPFLLCLSFYHCYPNEMFRICLNLKGILKVKLCGKNAHVLQFLPYVRDVAAGIVIVEEAGGRVFDP